MNTIFGGQFMSRLNMNLREDKGYTYGARSSFDWHVHAPGAFVASSSVKTDVTAAALVEFLKEIDGLRGAMPVKPEELNDAKDYITRGYPGRVRDDLANRRAVGNARRVQLPDDYFNTMIPKLSAVTADDVLGGGQEVHPPEQPLDHHRGRPGEDRKEPEGTARRQEHRTHEVRRRFPTRAGEVIRAPCSIGQLR